MRFNAETSANDLLLAIVAKRIPEFAGFPKDDHSGGRVHPNSRMSASSKRLGRDYVLMGEKVSKDPYLEKLIGNLRSYGPASVRRNEQTTQTIHIGDVVVYEEEERRKVMSAVIGFKIVRSHSDAVVVQVQVQRLYSFHELLGIVDRLQHYRSKPKLVNVDFEKENSDLSADQDYIQARAEYCLLRSNLLSCFQHPQAAHKVIVMALSNFVTTIQANNVHKILHLSLHPDTVENVAPDGSAWPSAANVLKVLQSETVVYSHLLDTSKWKMHPIELPDTAMTESVLAAASQVFKTAQSATLRGLLGLIRRHIHDRMHRLVSKPGAGPQSAVANIPCTFAFFAYLVYITDAGEKVSVEWDKKSKAWRAHFRGPQSLHKHLGVGWESVSKEQFYAHVRGGIVLRYAHSNPTRPDLLCFE